MSKVGVEHDLSTFSAAVAQKLRELRHSRGWSMEEFMDKLAIQGIVQEDGSPIPMGTAYSYERGKHHGGADIPLDYYPAVAAIYGYRTPTGWLPEVWPK